MKTAICLYGLVGNIQGKSGDSIAGAEQVLELASKHWHEFILNNNNCDIFIHSWNIDLKKQIRKTFQPKKFKFEEQIKFNIPDYVLGEESRKQNHYSRWYSARESILLMEAYEKENKFTYDMVMSARFDIAWKKPIIFKDYKPENFYCGGWHRKNRKKVKDFWFFSSSKNMKNFLNIYNHLDKYNLPENATINTKLGISNHRLAKYHIDKLKFNTEYILYCGDDIDASQSDYPLIRYEYFGAKK